MAVADGDRQIAHVGALMMLVVHSRYLCSTRLGVNEVMQVRMHVKTCARVNNERELAFWADGFEVACFPWR